MTVWLLCMMLDRNSSTPPTCLREVDEETCHLALVEWIIKAEAWERRSKLKRSAFAGCEETEEQST